VCGRDLLYRRQACIWLISPFWINSDCLGQSLLFGEGNAHNNEPQHGLAAENVSVRHTFGSAILTEPRPIDYVIQLKVPTHSDYAVLLGTMS
jgi:hypothetical protein